MANLIDSTYFKGEILLTNKTALADDLSEAITRYEKEILILLLGYKLYKQLVATPTVEPYKSLIDGAEFEMSFDGITQLLKWEGLKNSVKESLIANYVFYKYQERTFSKTSAINVVKGKAEAAEIVSPLPKMINAWNRMIELYGFVPDYWHGYNVTIIQPTAESFYDNLPSAYNYMVANITDFPDWIFTPLKQINPFMI